MVSSSVPQQHQLLRATFITTFITATPENLRRLRPQLPPLAPPLLFKKLITKTE